jgi:iron-sulfur cluster insertion protein
MTEQSFSPLGVNITEAAVNQLKSILDEMGDEAASIAGLRVFVTGGGCSGFQYGFSFATNQEEDDTVFDHSGVKILVDPMSLQYLASATVDFQTDIHGSQFIIQNPNATSSCGCGKSFSA